MPKPYHFLPVTRALHWVEREPSNHLFTCHFKFMMGFNPVITDPLYMAHSYRDACDYMEAVAAYMPNTKRRQILVKQSGVRHRHYFYDERFDEALRAEDIDGDQFYKEPTEDDRFSVQLHHKKGIVVAKWRGANRRSETVQPSADSVIDTVGGFG